MFDTFSQKQINFLLPRLLHFLSGNEYSQSDYRELLRSGLGFGERMFAKDSLKEAERLCRILLSDSCKPPEYRVRTNLFCLEACVAFLGCNSDSLGPKIVKTVDFPRSTPEMKESLLFLFMAVNIYLTIVGALVHQLEEKLSTRLSERQGDRLIQATAHQFVITMSKLSSEYPVLADARIGYPSTSGISMLANALAPIMPDTREGFFRQGERLMLTKSCGPGMLDFIEIVELDVPAAAVAGINLAINNAVDSYVKIFTAEVLERSAA